MNILKKVWDWLVYSSSNPEKISLTLKGLVPFAVLFGFVDSGALEAINNAVVNLLVQAGSFVTAGATLYGAVRKVYLSFKK